MNRALAIQLESADDRAVFAAAAQTQGMTLTEWVRAVLKAAVVAIEQQQPGAIAAALLARPRRG